MQEWRFCVNRPADVRCRTEEEGRYLLYNPRTDGLHLLGPLEKAIYDLCDGRSINDVVDAAAPLFCQYGADPGQDAASEVLGFLAALHERELITYQ